MAGSESESQSTHLQIRPSCAAPDRVCRRPLEEVRSCQQSRGPQFSYRVVEGARTERPEEAAAEPGELVAVDGMSAPCDLVQREREGVPVGLFERADDQRSRRASAGQGG